LSVSLRNASKSFEGISRGILDAIIGLVELANRLENLVAKFETVLPRI
jgi:hypothetical protein